jgi:hypothetical protein
MLIGWGALVALGCGEDAPSKAPLAPSTSDAGAAGAAGAEAFELPAIEPGPAIRTREEYCLAEAELAEEWCDYIDSCCTDADQADLYFTPGACSSGHEDPSDCLTTIASIELAGATWDGSAVDECIAAIAKLYPAAPVTCSGLDVLRWAYEDHGLHGYSQQPACRRMLAGFKGQNEPCDFMQECELGLVCAPSNQDDLSQPYVCLPEAGRGSQCLSDSRCQHDLFCVGVGDRHCGDLVSLGGRCLYTSECEAGLGCSPLGYCSPVVGVGQGCGETAACSLDLGCDFVTNSCVAMPQLGQPCTSSCNGRCENGVCVETCGGTLF